jgi:hypothetical protein
MSTKKKNKIKFFLRAAILFNFDIDIKYIKKKRPEILIFFNLNLKKLIFNAIKIKKTNIKRGLSPFPFFYVPDH